MWPGLPVGPRGVVVGLRPSVRCDDAGVAPVRDGPVERVLRQAFVVEGGAG